MKQRLDNTLVARGFAPSRSQAEHLIAFGEVKVDGLVATKSGQMVGEATRIDVVARQRYVSRAGLKLASVANKLSIQFAGATVLDVGSSTGGFTDYALRHGADKVIAVDVGTDQLHPSLRGDRRIELHEKTDIRDFVLSTAPDIILMDVSFISARQVLPHLAGVAGPATRLVIMIKPQFEARRNQLTRGGIVKNDRQRRQILADFEVWARQYFVIEDKADSDVAGTHGNRERFYRLKARPVLKKT